LAIVASDVSGNSRTVFASSPSVFASIGILSESSVFTRPAFSSLLSSPAASSAFDMITFS
jgi:hypothetical protein